MAKRGYKLQEFVAHSANVNCLKIGKKTHPNFITGGDDEKVNLWSIGKPTATMSLSGHTSPIESVAFDSTEVLVAAGASSGVIKLWDLEETKVVRTLSGHRSYCTALEFHPFGEFFASGSMDTNLKIWDIRKKGRIHTYKGHRRAVSTIRFSPDGRWVVSGGLDNVVKIWDLTAGKLLHEFKFHEGHIRSMDFHPVEFLLATGSSDKTVKFWDLETFELIGSTRPETTGVRAITFHPDGRTLFCGLDSSLKVYSWEPVVCHDGVDMGWSTLGDICIDDGKLLGCSYYQNSVAVWVADTTQIEQHGHSILAEKKTHVQPKFNLKQDKTEKVGSPRRSTMSTDDDTKDIKNIYVDSVTPVSSRKPPMVVNLQNPKEIDNSATLKQDINIAAFHRRRPSTTKLDIEVGVSITNESGLKSVSDSATVVNFQKMNLSDDDAKNSSKEKTPISTSVTNEFQKASSPGDSKEEKKSVKYVNGVAVMHGRTRSLVERFEKRDKLNTDESQTPDLPTQTSNNTDMHVATRVEQSFDAVCCSTPEAKKPPERVKTPDAVPFEEPKTKTSQTPVKTPGGAASKEPEVRVKTPDEVAFEEHKYKTSQMLVKTPEAKTFTISMKAADVNNVTPMPVTEAKTLTMPEKRPDVVSRSPMVQKPDSTHVVVVQRSRTAPSMSPPEKGKGSPMQRSVNSRRVMPERIRPSPMLVTRRSNASPRVIPERTKTSPVVLVSRHDNNPNRMITEKAKSCPSLDDIPQTTGRGLMYKRDDEIADDLMLNHDVFLSSLRSRLTKLQVVRHFFEKNDTRGGINALKKLPDHAVQADVVSVLMEKMDSLTLDLFSDLLPVLLGLLDSNTERHINISLEILLKLVAVFGTVVNSTISAPPTVGVDIHAEKRLECCNQCHIQLQKIHKCLPSIIRRGSLPARCAQELNIILQKS